jgi:very-short-patch-repair endonuclease
MFFLYTYSGPLKKTPYTLICPSSAHIIDSPVLLLYITHLLSCLRRILRLFGHTFLYCTFVVKRRSMSRITEHNREIMAQAEYRAKQMEVWPSPLEEKMQEFLIKRDIYYETQKIFYIYADDGWITRYYIADFFVPEANLIIEVDGKFHDNQKQKDKNRTKDIQENYPNVEVFRWKWSDFKDIYRVEELLEKINYGIN